LKKEKMEKLFRINFSNGNSAKAIRISKSDQIINSIKKLGLRLGQPTIVLVGGAGGLTDEDLKRLQFLFLDILAPLAENIYANVIDGGTDAGVMRLMGQARAKINAKFSLIGIAAEGTVILPGGESLNPETALLESHHTHFVLIPGKNWGDESRWLSRFATELGKTVSSITVLINGGEIARKDVAHSLFDKRPVVVFGGSGRLADELASDYRKNSPLIKIIDQTDSSENILALLKNLLKR
jgi:hypothetical protein